MGGTPMLLGSATPAYRSSTVRDIAGPVADNDVTAMLSARAYSFRQKSKLAISLSWIGGYVNVVLLLACGTFASHMTGNATRFGELVVMRDWTLAAQFGLILVSF